MTNTKNDTSIPAATTEKKTVRRRKVSTPSASLTQPTSTFPSSKQIDVTHESFSILLTNIEEARREFDTLQRDISQTREEWLKEQKDHEAAVVERDRQIEVERKREEETYRYEFALRMKKAEDEFADKQTKWDKELLVRKEEIRQDREELEALRKTVASFEAEKEKAVKEATILLQKELNTAFGTERKMREQEVKADKELSSLKIESLSQEKAKLEKEVASLKSSLEAATRELKDVAVKVIEASKISSRGDVTASGM